MLYNMYNLFSFIVQLLLFLAQFVQCCTQYCTQGARPPSLCRCSCAQQGLLVLYASTRAQVHHHHADYKLLSTIIMQIVEHFLSSILSFIKSQFSRQSTVLERNSNQDSKGGRRSLAGRTVTFCSDSVVASTCLRKKV